MRYCLLLLCLLCGCDWESFLIVSESSILTAGEEVRSDIAGRWYYLKDNSTPDQSNPIEISWNGDTKQYTATFPSQPTANAYNFKCNRTAEKDGYYLAELSFSWSTEGEILYRPGIIFVEDRRIILWWLDSDAFKKAAESDGSFVLKDQFPFLKCESKNSEQLRQVILKNGRRLVTRPEIFIKANQ